MSNKIKDLPEEEEEEMNNPANGHYVNNKELLAEFVLYRKKYLKWVKDGKIKETRPALSNKIGISILNIAHKRCNSWNFVNYTIDWKEEMIEDAIEICVRYAHNFNPEKSNNPFAYLTQMINNAFKQRIKIEQKNQYIKAKSFDNSRGYVAFEDGEGSDFSDDIEVFNETSEIYKDRLNFISEYEVKNEVNKERKKKETKSSGTSINILDELNNH